MAKEAEEAEAAAAAPFLANAAIFPFNGRHPKCVCMGVCFYCFKTLPALGLSFLCLFSSAISFLALYISPSHFTRARQAVFASEILGESQETKYITRRSGSQCFRLLCALSRTEWIRQPAVVLAFSSSSFFGIRFFFFFLFRPLVSVTFPRTRIIVI